MPSTKFTQTKQRKIIHVDMDAFFAAVEQRDNPRLRNRPVIVGGQPNSRGVVATCSYEARKFGIHSAMPCSRAYQLCPQAVFIKPRIGVYRQVSQQVHQIFKEYTELIEPLSLDEAYLDVTENRAFDGSASLVAKDIRQKIHKATGLTASAGISYNKFLAKIASDMNKPNGQYVIRPEEGEHFVANLPVGKFYGIGKVTEARMHALGIYTGKDLRALSKQKMIEQFGKSGQYYYSISRAIDERPVITRRVRKSIGAERTFQQDLVETGQMISILQQLSDEVMKSLSNKQLVAYTLTIKVKYYSFQQVTRSITLEDPIVNLDQVYSLLPVLLGKTEAGHLSVRLLGVSVSNLSKDVHTSRDIQLDLFDE